MTRTTLQTRRPNLTTDTVWQDHAITVTVGFDLLGSPREVFANAQRGGAMQATLADACVLISIALQHDVSPADLSKSLQKVPEWVNGKKTDAPASPVGAIIGVIIEVDK